MPVSTANTQRLWDISPAIATGIPVWPGDSAYTSETTWQIADGCPVKVSKITMSTHTGAHCDAPSHYDAEGKAIDEVDLQTYIGRCRVISLHRCAPGRAATYRCFSNKCAATGIISHLPASTANALGSGFPLRASGHGRTLGAARRQVDRHRQPFARSARIKNAGLPLDGKKTSDGDTRRHRARRDTSR